MVYHQMFGSVAPALDMSSAGAADPPPGGDTDCEQVSIQALFHILLALETVTSKDELDILDLVDGDKPLTALVRLYQIYV